ncbi:MAG: tetratricopeptide repeat protein, partial [Limisphaerales bacterium]
MHHFHLRNSPVTTNAAWRSTFKNWLPAVVIFVAVIVAFWPALSGAFIWDDDAMLTGNPLIRGPLRAYWFTTQPVDYFPLTYTSLWLEWRLWGLNPTGYHVTNVVLHALSCIILWRAFVRLNFPSAWLAAFLFALHPVTVESVAWIAERKNVLAMFFYSLTVWSFIRFAQSGKRTFYILSLSAFLLSLLAKTAAAGWPIIAFAIGWWILGNSTFSKQNHSSRWDRFTKCTVWMLPFLVVALSLSVATVWFQYNRAIGDDTFHHHDFFTRIAAAGTAVWFYIGKALVPYPVMFFYPMWDINSHSLISFVPTIALVALFVILWMFRARWSSPYLFALGYFVLLLAPILGFFNIYFQRYSYVADHWQYFALPAITIMIAAGLNKFKLQYTIGAGLALAFAFLTFNESRVYHDPHTLWADTYRKNPQSWVALNYLALDKELAGRVDEAIQLYSHSLELNPEQSESHTGLGKSFCMLGKTNEALKQYEEAIRINPHHAIPYCNVAGIFQSQGKTDEAIRQYREALRFQPNYAPAYNSIGRLLCLQGRREEGIAELRHALAIDPEFPPALINLGVFLTDQNQADQALPFCQKAVALY